MPCPTPDHESCKNPLQLLLLLLVASLATLSVAPKAEACGDLLPDFAAQREANTSSEVRPVQFLSAPRLVGAGFASENPTSLARTPSPNHLWIEVQDPPRDAYALILESVWGPGPQSLEHMWSQPIPLHNGLVEIMPTQMGAKRDQAFTVGFRVRFVGRDGTLSAPSSPVFLSHTGSVKHRDGVTPGKVMMLLCCAALFGLWVVFRRDDNPVHRIRLAAMAALTSLFFLSVAPALSWVTTVDPSGRLAAVDCHVGDEAQCATYVPDAGPNPASTSDVAAQRHFELVSWMGASSALRFGLVWCLVLLLPALIWLMVVPTLRAAQTAVALGASAAGYTFLATLLYWLCIPSWMTAKTASAFDLTLLTSGSIVAAIALIVHWSLRLAMSSETELPTAVVRRG